MVFPLVFGGIVYFLFEDLNFTNLSISVKFVEFKYLLYCEPCVINMINMINTIMTCTCVDYNTYCILITVLLIMVAFGWSIYVCLS